MKGRKPITRDEWSGIILVLAITAGAFLRFNPTLLAGFAVNDGGMFAVMVDDLKANHFILPKFTTYNQLDIPYAYPPLGFYLGALASIMFGWDSIQVVRWMPAFFASLSIPAFYLLALRLFKERYRAAVATLFFAFMPRAIWWFVMGGGLTRSPGLFFMLLTLAVAHRLFEENRRIDVLWAGIFGGMAVLSHPEAAVYTVVSSVFFWIYLSRKRDAFVNALLVAVVVLVVIAPWLAAVISNHGIAPLRNAAATGSNSTAIFHLVFFIFSEEPYATVIAVLGLIGIAQRFARRDHLLPLWMAIPFFVEGRSATGPASIPLAMLAAVGLVDVILPALQKSVVPEPQARVDVHPMERNIFIYLILYLVFSTYQFGVQASNATLSSPYRDAMDWIKSNIPMDARFLVLTGTTSVACDPVLEWFPAISGRQSVYTIQGAEWTKGRGFSSYVTSTYAVQECLAEGNVACLDEAVDPVVYEYVYISKQLRVDNCKPLPLPLDFSHFVSMLNLNPWFEKVYENEWVLVSRRK